MYPDYIINYLDTASIYSLLLLFILIILYRKKIVSIYDPILLELILFSCYTGGLIAYISCNDITFSGYFILAQVLLIILIGAILKVPKTVKFNLGIKRSTQICLIVTVLIVFLLYFYDQLPALISNFKSGNARFYKYDTASNRFLLWAVNSFSPIGPIFFALSDIKIVRNMSIILIGLSLLQILLSASLFTVPGIVYYILTLVLLRSIKRGKRIHLFTKKEIKYLMRGLILLPVIIYFSLYQYKQIGLYGDNYIINYLLIRIFGGFDQLLYVVRNNLTPENIGYLDAGLIEYYFMSFFKLFGNDFTFNNISELLYYNFSGHLDGAKITALPNNNIILEGIFIYGYIFSIFLTVIISISIFKLRSFLLSRRTIKLYHLPLFIIFLQPVSFFLSGQDNVMKLIISIIIWLSIYFFIELIPNILMKNIKSNKASIL